MREDHATTANWCLAGWTRLSSCGTLAQGVRLGSTGRHTGRDLPIRVFAASANSDASADVLTDASNRLQAHRNFLMHLVLTEASASS